MTKVPQGVLELTISPEALLLIVLPEFGETRVSEGLCLLHTSYSDVTMTGDSLFLVVASSVLSRVLQLTLQLIWFSLSQQKLLKLLYRLAMQAVHHTNHINGRSGM